MQGANGRGTKQSSRTLVTSEWAKRTEKGCLAVEKEETGNERMDVIQHDAVQAVDMPLSFQDEEMISWLAYPLDNPLERNYCSDLFGDVPNPSIQLFPESFTHQSFKDSECHHISGSCDELVGTGRSSECVGGRRSEADIAMALGAGRATGFISQSGTEAFNRVRTTMQPSVSICTHDSVPLNNSKSLEVKLPLSEVLSPRSHGLAGISPSLQTSKAMDAAAAALVAPPQQAKAGSMNFSHFSRPIAETKASLHIIGSASGPTSIERVRHQNGKAGMEGLLSRESSVVESTTTFSSGLGSYAGVHLQQQGTEVSQSANVERDGRLGSSLFSSPETDVVKGKNMELDTCLNPSIAASAVTAADKGAEVLEAPDLTITSPSRGSGNSTEKSGKEAATSSKRKASQGEESEYQSEDIEEVAVNIKKLPSGRSSSTKRSRAAEIHNLSERRRRDRINEKMRALQELIPNSNKTDKASMLDEAIEYLKMLQSQLQMMSMRTGMGVSPMMIPMGMHQMQQMTTFPHIGIGMGMGMIDLGVTATGRAAVPMPPVPGQVLATHVTAAANFQPSSSSIIEPQNCLQNSGLPTLGVIEPYSALLASQQLQPVHLNTHVSMDTHNAFVQQHQQQWQLRQCHPQGHNGSKPNE